MRRKSFASCPSCLIVYEVAVSGIVRAIGVAAAVLAALRWAQPWIALLGTAAALAWGDRLEQKLAARCPRCRTALDFIGRTLPV